MSKKLKVYSGYTFEDGMQVSTIVATTSKKRCSELTGESYKTIREYWSVTGNEVQIQFAMSKPETIFKSSSTFSKDYREVNLSNGGL